jgi:hypothetical protein
VKPLRIFAGLVLIGLLLHAAALAVKDCTVGILTYDNCMWIWVREKLGLPPSKLGRAALLELVGLALLAGLYLTIRYIFPRRQTRESSLAE